MSWVMGCWACWGPTQSFMQSAISAFVDDKGPNAPRRVWLQGSQAPHDVIPRARPSLLPTSESRCPKQHSQPAHGSLAEQLLDLCALFDADDDGTLASLPRCSWTAYRRRPRRRANQVLCSHARTHATSNPPTSLTTGDHDCFLAWLWWPTWLCSALTQPFVRASGQA